MVGDLFLRMLFCLNDDYIFLLKLFLSIIKSILMEYWDRLFSCYLTDWLIIIIWKTWENTFNLISLWAFGSKLLAFSSPLSHWPSILYTQLFKPGIMLFIYCQNIIYFPVYLVSYFPVIYSILVSEDDETMNNPRRGNNLNSISFIFFNFIFVYYIIVFFVFSNNSSYGFYLFDVLYESEIFDIEISFGIDNFNIFFLLLTSFLFPLCILINWNMAVRDMEIFIWLCCILEVLLLLSFMTTNLLCFFFLFEATLIPMYFIISYWGSRERKVHASYYFFIYTSVGSIFILTAIFLLYSFYYTLDVRVLWNINIDVDKQIIIFILLFIGFAIKIPIPPFHLWLPEAHVEASTAGSVILAGVLLKLGTYGMLRFLFPLCGDACIIFKNLVYMLCAFSVFYVSCIAIRQTDLKKIIAYSSIGHMAFVVVGLFSFSTQGLVGSVYLMISHGLVSAALFSCIGILYERTKTRDIIYYRNIAENMPLFSFFFFIFILSNIAFPFTSGFIGEFLILNSIVEINMLLAIIFVLSTFFTASYSIWLYNRVCFNIEKINIKYLNSSLVDLRKNEFYLMVYPFVFIILLGLFPSIVTNKLDIISDYYIEKILKVIGD